MQAHADRQVSIHVGGRYDPGSCQGLKTNAEGKESTVKLN